METNRTSSFPADQDKDIESIEFQYAGLALTFAFALAAVSLGLTFVGVAPGAVATALVSVALGLVARRFAKRGFAQLRSDTESDPPQSPDLRKH